MHIQRLVAVHLAPPPCYPSYLHSIEALRELTLGFFTIMNICLFDRATGRIVVSRCSDLFMHLAIFFSRLFPFLTFSTLFVCLCAISLSTGNELECIFYLLTNA